MRVIQEGICTLCHKNPHAEDRMYCEPCMIAKKLRIHAKYGLTPELLAQLGTVCHICGDAGKLHEMHIDHDHKHGFVRGLLCRHCNVGLGAFKESAEILLKAVEYLYERKPEHNEGVQHAIVKAATGTALTKN